MKPPVCAVCGSGEGCDVLDFRKTREGDEFRKGGKVGHDPDCDWFCGTHLPLAKALSRLTIAEALEAMKGS